MGIFEGGHGIGTGGQIMTKRQFVTYPTDHANVREVTTTIWPVRALRVFQNQPPGY